MYEVSSKMNKKVSIPSRMSEKDSLLSSRVPARDVRKLKAVLERFSQPGISRKHWPICLRDYIAETLSRGQDISRLPEARRHELCNLLKEPSRLIPYQQRREILDALQTIYDHLLQGAVKLRPLEKQESPDPSKWPQIIREEDLAADFTDDSPPLYRPAKAWLLKRLMNMGGTIGCSSIYFDSTAAEYPISISVEKNVAFIRDFLAEESRKMVQEGWLDLTPSDVVCFNEELLTRPQWNEESGWITGGCAIRGGSIGGIVRLNDHSLAAITSFHVLSSDPCHPLEQNRSLEALEHYGDIVVVPLRRDDYDHDVMYNFARLQMMITEDLHAKPGETVFKLGRGTGLTVGTLRHINNDHYDPPSGRLLEGVVEVDWDRGDFSASRDSGAFYCLRRQIEDRQVFVPIAVHRMGDGLRRISYGSALKPALDYLLADSFEFVNSEEMFYNAAGQPPARDGMSEMASPVSAPSEEDPPSLV